MEHRELLKELLSLWFKSGIEELWFCSTVEFDEMLRDRFEAIYIDAQTGKLDHLVADDELALALVILLDQIPLNIYRHDARRYAGEQKALNIARQVITRGADQPLGHWQKAFLYMPFMHSENLDHQKESIRLLEQAGMEENVNYARHHHAIVERFGRFPHRNEHLGRASTEEEIAWLNSEDGFSM